MSRSDHFPSEITGLPPAHETEVVELADGAEYDLRIAPVAKQLGDATVRMLAYNGSIPGPTLKVRQGSEVVVNVVNDGDLESTVHWHGLRLDNRYDGTHETQTPVPVGGSFTARCRFPDPGAYWYHPHIREDYGQEMGLYGNIIVEPTDPAYWPKVHREIALTLDDILLRTARSRPSAAPRRPTRRWGASVTRCSWEGRRTRRCAPSERVVVDVLFDDPGDLTLEHRTPTRAYPLATIDVSADRIEPSLADEFETLRTNADLVEVRGRVAEYVEAAPDKTLGFIAEMDLGGEHGHHDHGHGGHGHDPAGSDGIEWEDEMVEVNRMTTPANMRWKLIDRETGAENAAIDWRFRVGDKVKIRLRNEMGGDHPMHHPFHVHGAGRFLVLSRDARTEENLVWKDTVLVQTGETVDILLEVTNPGRWMAHCHIAEHHESGMMLTFDVTD
ncbi:MAG: multicopper oxidase family protein [Candidatus Limnocylindrales bacterium]